MTNMVFFPLGEGDVSDEEFEKRCLDRGMLIHMVSPRRRALRKRIWTWTARMWSAQPRS